MVCWRRSVARNLSWHDRLMHTREDVALCSKCGVCPHHWTELNCQRFKFLLLNPALHLSTIQCHSLRRAIIVHGSLACQVRNFGSPRMSPCSSNCVLLLALLPSSWLLFTSSSISSTVTVISYFPLHSATIPNSDSTVWPGCSIGSLRWRTPVQENRLLRSKAIVWGRFAT